MISIECLRKKARGDVTVKFPGSGKISINGQDITYFEYDQSREQVSVYTSSLIQIYTYLE